MAPVCQHCGKAAIDEELGVCQKCGVVCEGMTFDTTFNVFCSDTKPTFHRFTKKQNSETLDYGIDTLEKLCIQHYSVSPELKANTTDLLKEVYFSRYFRNRQDVGILAGCCLIHKMKEKNLHVTIEDLSRKLECTKKQAFKFAKILRAYLSSNQQRMPDRFKTEEMDWDSTFNFEIKAVLESTPIENKEKLIPKIIALVKLAQSCWIITGRSREGVIVASTFWCWKSMNPNTRNLSFKAFCSEFSLPYNKGQPRVSEVRDMLLKLGQKIPSITKDYVNVKNLMFHLDYILENSESLRNDLLCEEFSAEEIDKKEFSTFRKDRNYYRKNGYNYDEIQSAETCDSSIEISDAEISSYIRSEEQVQAIMSLRKNKT